MQTLIYDGSFYGFLSAVFDVYEYKFVDPDIQTQDRFKGNIFEKIHYVTTDAQRQARLWKGLGQKISKDGLRKIYRAFLSEQKGMENLLLSFIQYVFSSPLNVEYDYSNATVLTITQTAKKVYREKHRMEAFVRFQKTADGLYYAVVEPDFNVLPLIVKHFTRRYADQRWMIYDTCRKYGIYFDGKECCEMTIEFNEQVLAGDSNVYDESEDMYQKLWASYFTHVNIAARKNTKLHVQHVPKRYWKYLTEKLPANL